MSIERVAICSHLNVNYLFENIPAKKNKKNVLDENSSALMSWNQCSFKQNRSTEGSALSKKTTTTTNKSGGMEDGGGVGVGEISDTFSGIYPYINRTYTTIKVTTQR